MSRQIASAQQQMSRESESQAQTAMSGFNSSISSAWNTLQQFTGQRGNSSTMTQGADSSQGGQSTMMASKMRSAVESYAKANNISEDQATQELAQSSVNASAGLHASLTGRVSGGLKVMGTGATVEAAAGGKASIDGVDHDSHSASSGTRASQDARHDASAQAASDFKQGMDYFTSQKTSESGSHSQNNADSRVDQLAASLNSAKSSYTQYSDAHTRSQEYAEMASRTETMSGQMSENLTQQFANFVAKRAPDNAEEILTNTSSPEVAAQRSALAREFVNEQVAPGVDAHYTSGSAALGSGMGTVSGGGNSDAVQADYASHSQQIDRHASSAGIANNVGDKVDTMISGNKNAQAETRHKIDGQSSEINDRHDSLKENHSEARATQNEKYTDEKEKQKLITGASTQEELTQRAREMQDNFNKKK